MKQSRTVLKELTAAYRAVLRHGILCNAIALGIIIAATPAMAVVEATDGVLVNTDITEKYHVNDVDAVFDGASAQGLTGAKYGGVIEAEGANAHVTINDFTFANNSSVSTSGAVDNYTSHLSITGSTLFDGNSSGRGGAVNNWGNGTLNIDGSVVFNDNTAAAFVQNGLYKPNGKNYYLQNYYGGLGGALYSNSTATISGATFSDNKVKQVLLLAYSDAEGETPLESQNTYMAGDGGAIYNGGNLTIEDVRFVGNDAEAWGGAIATGGTLNIDNAVFDGNTAKYAGAIIDYLDSTGGVSVNGTISNTIFKNNTADEIGGVGLYTRNAVSNFNNVEFNGNKATDGSAGSDGSGAMFIGAEARANIQHSVFDGNESAAGAGAIGTRSFALGNDVAAKLDIADSVFANNTAATKGGAINNYLYNDAADDGYVKVTNTTFTSNSAADGGAVYNNIGKAGEVLSGGLQQVGKMYFADSDFVNNTASDKGGAIYNEGELTIAAVNKDVLFSGNKASIMGMMVDNDIYNTGTLNLNAAAGKTVNLNGGIDGQSGTVELNGLGTVVVNNMIHGNQVNVNSGELAFNDTSVWDATVSVKSGATMNAQDGVIDTYYSDDPLTADYVKLENGANVKIDVDNQSNDQFGIASGSTVTLTGVKMLEDLTSSSVTRLLSKEDGMGGGYGNVNIANGLSVFTTDYSYSLSGNSVNDGTFTINKGMLGTGGFEAAGNYTATSDNVVYNLTDDDVLSSTVTLRGENMTVFGQGIGDADSSIDLNGNTIWVGAGVGDPMALSIEDAKIGGDGEIIVSESTDSLNIKDSKIAVAITNYGTLISDPSIYGSEVVNYGTASFADDTFEAGSSLENNAITNLSSVIFKQGSAITGNGSGTINLVSGRTVFDTNVTNNNMTLADGATLAVGEHGSIANAVSFTANGGNIDLQNGKYDSVGAIVANSNVGMSLDANLRNGNVDNVASVTGSGSVVVNDIKLANAGYADTGSSQTLHVVTGGGANSVSLADNMSVTGGTNYFTKVSADNGDVVFSDKLMNTSGMHAQLGDWNGTIIGTSTAYDTNTDSYSTTQGTTVGEALEALDGAVATLNTTVAAKANASDVYTKTEVDAALSGKLTADSALDGTKLNDYSVSFSKLDDDMITDSTELAALASDWNAASDTKVMTEKAVVQGITNLISQKEDVMSQELGYDVKTTDAHTVLVAQGFTDQNSDGKVSFLDATVSNATAAQSNATAIQNIEDGTTVVGKATKAVQDENGNNIASTYATNTSLTLAANNAVATANAYTDTQLSLVRDASLSAANAYTDERIEHLDKNLSAGVAGAVALSSVAVSGVERGEVSVGAGYGYFNGQSAAAFGAAMGLSNRWSVNAGAGVSNADVSFRAGTNYKFKLF